MSRAFTTDPDRGTAPEAAGPGNGADPGPGRRSHPRPDDARVENALRVNAADLLGYLTRRADRQDAADVLGAIYAVAWRRRADLPADPTAARMWLFGVARRTLANHRRAGARASALTDRLRVTLASAPASPYPGNEAQERAREVREAIERLPSRQREMVRLVHWDGFTLAEAAQIAGLRASTARSHYARARQALARQLGAVG